MYNNLHRGLREADLNVVADSNSAEFVSIPFYDAAIPCGKPTDIGFVEEDGFIRLPMNMLGKVQGTISLSARGDSMIDADIQDGDTLTVKLTKDVHDGDVVIASLDGDMTCKVLFRKAPGCTMLLPRNPNYEPIVIEDGDYSRVDILGVVTNIVHPAPYTPHHVCSSIVDAYEKAKRKQHPSVPSEEKVESALRRINPVIGNSRQWLPVLRILMDCGYYADGDFRGFVDDLTAHLGASLKHEPDADDLRRICVLVMAKPFEEWKYDEATFGSERRYNVLCSIAKRFKEMIS